MARSQKPGFASAAINITPLVDVLLVLIVVLMLALPLYVKRLPVDLPQTSLSGTPVPVRALPIAIGAGEVLYLKSSEATLADILAEVGPGVTVEMSVDKEVRYEVIAKVLAQIQTKSPKEIILLTR